MPMPSLLYCFLLPKYHPQPSLNIRLVTGADEIVCQLLDGCCCVPGDHAVLVMSDEDSLVGLDDDNSIPTLFQFQCQ